MTARSKYPVCMLRSLLILCCGSLLLAQTPPRVVSMDPKNGGTISAEQTELVVVFDQDMYRGGPSVCGGGVTLPKVTGRPRWKGDRTLIVPVRLQPDHKYELILNCPSSRTIRSKEGMKLTPTTWRFTTFPEKLRPWPEQEARNKAALATLGQLVSERYAYRDRVVKDWQAALQEQGGAVRNARTDRAFSVAAKDLLARAQDPKVTLDYRGERLPTWDPLIEPLYRTFAVRRLFELETISARAFRGRTDDGIGYLLITGWQDNVDVERLVGALTEMMDTRALVIDVRPNMGGDERNALEFARWFVAGDKVYAKERPLLPGGGLGDAVPRSIAGGAATYDRPVAVLSGPRVKRSCEAFVLMMRQGAGVQVVGQPTLGSSGEPVLYELGNGVSVELPGRQALRPDGTCYEGEGIAPDVFVPCTSRDLETGDPTLEKALALLRERIKKGG